MLIATGVDMMIYMSKVFELFSITLMIGIPVVTILLGIFWCMVEFLSVREKADSKIHSNIAKAEKLAQNMLSKEEWINILAEAFKQANKK